MVKHTIYKVLRPLNGKYNYQDIQMINRVENTQKCRPGDVRIYTFFLFAKDFGVHLLAYVR